MEPSPSSPSPSPSLDGPPDTGAPETGGTDPGATAPGAIDPAPNHHADHAGFSGVVGLLSALTMLVGRRADAELVVERTGVGPQDHAIDVGSGPGSTARRAARAGATVTGVDPAPVMRRLARRLSRRTGPGSVEYVDGTAEALPVADGAATVLWSVATVHHWQDVEAGVAEASRVLAPGGRLLVAERRTKPGATGLASHGWTDAQAASFVAHLTRAGFTGVEVDRCHAGRPLLVVTATRP